MPGFCPGIRVAPYDAGGSAGGSKASIAPGSAQPAARDGIRGFPKGNRRDLRRCACLQRRTRDLRCGHRPFVRLPEHRRRERRIVGRHRRSPAWAAGDRRQASDQSRTGRVAADRNHVRAGARSQLHRHLRRRRPASTGGCIECVGVPQRRAMRRRLRITLSRSRQQRSADAKGHPQDRRRTGEPDGRNQDDRRAQRLARAQSQSRIVSASLPVRHGARLGDHEPAAVSQDEHPRVQIHYSEYSLAKGQSSLNSINILVDLVIGRFLK